MLITLKGFTISPSRFSSQYFDTRKDCSCAEKISEGEECLQFKCKHIDIYQIETSFNGAACDLGTMKIFKGPKEVILSVNEVPSKIEWRYSNDKPFAIIYRIKGFPEVCRNQLEEKKTEEVLIIKGLKEYDFINGQVSAKLKDANLKARELAEQAYLKGKPQ
jgi:hypothetical protein